MRSGSPVSPREPLRVTTAASTEPGVAGAGGGGLAPRTGFSVERVTVPITVSALRFARSAAAETNAASARIAAMISRRTFHHGSS